MSKNLKIRMLNIFIVENICQNLKFYDLWKNTELYSVLLIAVE